MSNTPKPQANKTIDEILVNFSRNLHEYANGRGTGLEFRVESDRAKRAIQALITQQRQELIDEIKNAMGKPKEVDPIGDPFYLEYKGYNLAIEKLTRSLNKLEESDD